MILNDDHILALMTADPDTWVLAEVPGWLLMECRDLGLISQQGDGTWMLTPGGYRERQIRLGIELVKRPGRRED